MLRPESPIWRSLASSRSLGLGIEMNRFIQNENVVQLRKLIAITEGDPSRDEVRYQLLSLLLAEEEAKPRKLLDG